MTQKEAIESAKAAVAELFGDEGAVDISFEEIVRNDASAGWDVTIGLSRLRKGVNTAVLGNLATVPTYRRDYKVVTVADDGTVRAIRNRPDYE